MGDVLFGPFLRKGSYSRVQVLNHVQADERFGQLYQEAQQLNEVDELMLYRRYLQKGERILFHGTFDPALFNLLSDEGYDLYLIEPEAARTKQIAEKYQHKIYGWSHDVTDVVGPEYFDRIILPGTTILRYTRGELLLFFRNIRQLLRPSGRLLVSLYRVDHLKSIAHPIATRRFQKTLLFYGYQVDGERLLFNAYLKSENEEKISYAVEYLYEPNTLFEFATLSRYRGQFLYEGKTTLVLEFEKQ
ncbi:hypothetical protein AYO36_01080 [Exiguobacterium sp. KKBO11]|uniref:hypothetical protein n=1 Tax=Exiguobacterium sp. KKBO11 TaxID=1805000 RepID=UPI0007D78B69|nr:hypothetical protein [Exiguobacterium sp. KKBO11]OAI88762.1 hypothetical protein AYO36_01080 [Exiguobacterium sp. KKBO11]